MGSASAVKYVWRHTTWGERHSMETEKSVLSRLLRNLTIYGSAILTLLLIVFIAAVKLRLLAKFGYYLGSVGLCFLLAGMVLLFNTGLLLIGNILILAGAVFIVGFERSRTYREIFLRNRCCGRGLAKAGLVTFVSCLLASVATKIPLSNRIVNWLPLVKHAVEANTEEKLLQVSKCELCQF